MAYFTAPKYFAPGIFYISGTHNVTGKFLANGDISNKPVREISSLKYVSYHIS